MSDYVPGLWQCAKCNFTLVQSNLNAADGTVTARDDPGDKCPNCGVSLWRVTWQRHAEEMANRCEAAIIEAAGLRDALDRIARFEECFAAAADKHPGNEAGSAMAETLAKYACSILSGSPKAAADSFCDRCGTIRRTTDVCPLTGRNDCPPSKNPSTKAQEGER